MFHIIRRSLGEFQSFWTAWLPLMLLTAVTPVLVLGMPLLERRLVDNVIGARDLDLLVPTIVGYALLWVAITVCQQVASGLRSFLSERFLVHLRGQLFRHAERLSLAFSHREHSSRTTALVSNDAPMLADFFYSTVVLGLGSCVAIVSAVGLMLQLNWQLALAAGIAPPLVAVLAGYLTRPLRPASRRAQDKAAELTEHIQENTAGMREVAAFGREQSQATRINQILQDLLGLRMRLAFMGIGLQAGQSVLSLAVTLVVLGFGAYLVIIGHTTLGTVIAMRSFFNLFFQPLSMIGTMIGGAQQALGAAERVFDFLDHTPLVKEKPNAAAPRRVRGALAFEDVSFGYHADTPVLNGVSFHAEPGERVALVGPSGAGKSTLLGLVLRFYDPDRGRVLLDGVDLRELTLAGLREQIGTVFQDTFLFATTVRENVAFARLGADDAAIEAALRAAHAWDFIQSLPHGLDTQLGERGTRLSEGQRQRLAIARAILRDPRILLLDEPTSALDARTEREVQSALDELAHDRTTLVVAHRLSTILDANRILVVDHGRLLQQGTHAELLRQDGMYRDLFELQFGSQLRRSAERVLVAS
ncbi:MAG: ABC transporter ATP-binding protein [Chloroflexi bacterium]|nr:ABC transporter ATP-binding protein [Chloroflexota bacterium]